MAITIKNEHEIALMRESGRLLALVHEEMRKELKEGMTTKDIDRRLCMEFLLKKDIFRMEIS